MPHPVYYFRTICKFRELKKKETKDYSKPSELWITEWKRDTKNVKQK